MIRARRFALPALLAALAFAALIVGCGDDVASPGDGPDAALELDAGTGEPDGGTDASDAGTGGTDAGTEADAGTTPDAGHSNDAGLPPPPEPIASGYAQPVGIALDPTHVYFTSHDIAPDGALYKVSKSGGTVTPLLERLALPKYVAVQGTTVFFTGSLGV
ncbi:MAG: hypothetical protein ACK4YP_25215, partial [Myxococcota bacterium]